MGEGYISKSGDYISGDDSMGRLFNRREIVDDHPDYAETLAAGNHRVVWYGMTQSELTQAALASFVKIENWEAFLKGAVSYPLDIGWCGYGIVAGLGQVGRPAQERVQATGVRVWDVALEAGGIAQTIASAEDGKVLNDLASEAGREALNRVAEPVIDGVRDAATDVVVDNLASGKLTKLAFMGSVYLNYLATGGAYGFAGRWRGGQHTRMALAIFFARGVPGTALAIYNSPWFTWPMMAVTTAGSLIRLGERHYDKFGHVNNIDLLSILVSTTTGEDDPDEVDGITRNIYQQIKEQFYDLSWDYERDALERLGYNFGDEVPNRIRERVKSTTSELRELSGYGGYVGTPTEDGFYNFLIKAHNLAIRLKREGVEHPAVEKMIMLSDPTLLHFARMFFLSAANVVKKIDQATLNVLHEYDFWSMIQAELQAGDEINNPYGETY